MLKSHFLLAPTTQIGTATMATIQLWDERPTAIQILRTIDAAVFGADSSTFVLRTLEVCLDRTLETEQTTYEQLVKLATWRNME